MTTLRDKLRPVPSEHQEQVTLMHWWAVYPRKGDAVLFAIPNGGARNPRTGAMLKNEGVMPGIPDLCLIHAGKAFFIELKKQRGGRLSTSQIAAHKRLSKAGCITAVCYGWHEAQAFIENILDEEVG
jgi:hypothetical protein